MNISGVYKITNTITGDFYIGSSVNIKRRWTRHRSSSSWKENPNSGLYKDMAKYGRDIFKFEIIEETTELKEREQYYIEKLKPTYNNYRAKGQDTERYRKHNNQITKEYYQSEEHHDKHLAKSKEYNNRLCLYRDETITLGALSERFRKLGIVHYVSEAKKYLI